MKNWSNLYIAAPFVDKGRGPTGFDCWGLVADVLANHAGITVRTHEDISPDAGLDIVAALEAEIVSDDWIKVPLAKRREFDVVNMIGQYRSGLGFKNAENHFGIITTSKRLLHIEPGISATCVEVSHESVRDRIVAVFRHKALA